MFKKVVDELLEILPIKSKNILIARFGLDGSNPKTLEAIGNELGVTRERIRQIEEAAFRKLKESEKSESILKMFKKLLDVIELLGGLSSIRGFERELLKNKKITLLQENQLKIILNSCQKLKYKKGTAKTEGLWYLENKNIDLFQANKVADCLLKYFKEKKSPTKLVQILKDFKNNNLCDQGSYNFLFKRSEYSKNILETILGSNKIFKVNILNQWGLSKWKLIKPIGMRERAYLILKKYQKPLHFREITELINKHFDLNNPAISDTVCNVVICFEEFIAVESGIYALTEWKIFDEEIKKEIILFLENKSQNTRDKKAVFVDIDEIMEHIRNLKGNNIKDFIIQANLFDKNLFSRRGKKYILQNDNKLIM